MAGRVPRSGQLLLRRRPAFAPTTATVARRAFYVSARNLTASPASPPTNHSSKPDRTHLPLHGITVVSLEQAIAAPFCTRQLADLGARVIKVERPGGGDFARSYDSRVGSPGLSSHFVWANRSKESLALDLKQPKDLSILKRLIARLPADVLVQNLAPGAADRLGLSYETLRRDHPGLIVCDISGYGASGPYRDKKAYDLLIQSEAGLLSTTGGADGRSPAKVGISIADIASGMYAQTSIMGALMRRDKMGGRDGGGGGCRIDISMLEAMVEWMSFPLYYAYQGQPGPRPMGASHAAIYPYGPFETGGGGGGTVMLGVQNEREWTRLCAEVLQDAALATDVRFATNTQRVENREALRRILLAAFAQLSAEEVIARLDAAGIANAKVNDMQGVWEHPQLKARCRWTEVGTSQGPVPALLPPGVSNAGETKMDEVPSVGQHNEAILNELGL
ncbi:CAIB/BAIF family enzyme [Apiospora arundinis]|uniref:CoA-transferase family III n=1 Tax=Apiospora arundinis TaxID=335852 RepID=A0ABR2HL08_9PEZI